jgi:glutamate-1-semialdehyde 2,1-aminomutase
LLVAVGSEGAGLASAGQLPESLDASITLPWNDLPAVASALDRHPGEIAAVLMEPMMLNAGAILPRPEYLAGVRELCDRHGALLIFDEIITGFRIAPGGAAERFGVVPDLATYGKALAGSWPVGALAGPRRLMEPIGTGEVNHSGTFNANRMAMAAVAATLELLAEQPPYAELARVGGRLMMELSELGRDVGLRVQGLPMAFHVSFGPEAAEVRDYRSVRALDAARYRKLAELLWDEGVWVAARGIWYLSAAHGDRELDATLERFAAALRRL